MKKYALLCILSPDICLALKSQGNRIKLTH
jgi:hypothetical protein